MPSVAEKYREYLRDNLTASNVFSILPHAQKFEDQDLEDRCWEVIEKQTEEVVTSDEFVTVEQSLVESVMKREVLNVEEVELFKVVDRWAKTECERQGITLDGEAKRRILGEDIVKAIRFLLMSQKEFASVVIDSYILSFKEVGDLMKHYSNISTSALPFMHIQRDHTPLPSAQIFQRCNRFLKFSIKPNVSLKMVLGYARSRIDSVLFCVDNPIKLHGVQHFGSKGGQYTVSTEVKDNTDDSSVVKQSGT